MKSINNIFSYATSELSQDAFLCWLFSYAMKDADNNPGIKACAIDFLKQFVPELENEEEIWLSEMPVRQYKHIDILLTVNDKYKVIIEDKTFTEEHDNQLIRYFDIVEKDYKGYIVKGVYYKIGFQSNTDTIEEAEYYYVDLYKILATIEKYKSETESEVFQSYYQYILQWKNNIEKYMTAPVCEWGWAQINGFYNYLKGKFPEMIIDYGYVPNQTGGFYGMWFFNNSYLFNGEDCYELYLQCEFSNRDKKICYKVKSHSENKISKLERNILTCKGGDEKMNLAKKYGFNKPPRYGSGKTVTLGIYNNDSKELNGMSFLEVEKVVTQAVDNFKRLVKELTEQKYFYRASALTADAPFLSHQIWYLYYTGVVYTMGDDIVDRE